MEADKLTKKTTGDVLLNRGYWLFVDSSQYLSIHYVEGGWDKITEKFQEQIKYLEERLNQLWNLKAIKEWENEIKEYLIECNHWKE